MPNVLDPNNAASNRDKSKEQSQRQRLEEANFDYDYPRGLDLKPGSDQHQELKEMVMNRARDAHRVMSKRYTDWREIDKVLRTYVPPEQADDQKDKSSKTKTEPSIIIPQSYAILETLLTYMTAAFLQTPIWKYEGVGPEDVLGAQLMTHVVHQHAIRNRVGLSLHTQWRDAFAYGVGVVSPIWERKFGSRTVVREQGFMDIMRDIFAITNKKRDRQEDVLKYEGNKLVNIDPYSYLPDPNASAHEVQEAEYAGWIEKTNLMSFLGRDKDNNDYVFNGRYMTLVDGRSQLVTHGAHGGHRPDFSDNTSTNNPLHVVWMYINLIPSEWGIGRKVYPETWLFGVAGDKVIVAAQPLNLDHGMKPLAVCAPDYDGYTSNPVSRLSTVHDLQNFGDFLYSSHMQNIRKAINDMFVIDPSIINYYDAANPEPGKLMRARRSAWGKGVLKDSIVQFPVNDVTQSHVSDHMFLTDVMQQVSGATDLAQGRMSPRTSRVSASEVNKLSNSSLSRLEKIARVISMQSMQPIGHMFASHVQQLMEQETYIKLAGEMEKRLREDFNLTGEQGRLSVNPLDMVVNFDVVPHDGTIPGAEDANTWIQLYQIIVQNPILAQQFDMPRIFKHIARQMGAKNVDQFVKPNPQVVPDDQVQNEVQKGNLVAQNGQQ